MVKLSGNYNMSEKLTSIPIYRYMVIVSDNFELSEILTILYLYVKFVLF